MLLSAEFNKIYTAVGRGRQTDKLTCQQWCAPGPNGRVSWLDSSSGRSPAKVGRMRRRGFAWRRSPPNRRAPGRRLRPHPTIDWRTRPRLPWLWIRSRPGNSSSSSLSTRPPKRLPAARLTAMPVFPVCRNPREKEWDGVNLGPFGSFCCSRFFTGPYRFTDGDVRSDVLTWVFR